MTPPHSFPRFPVSFGVRWRPVRVAWVVAVLLLAPALVGAPGSASASAGVLATPPTGGLTQGLAGTGDPAALVAAQDFEVQSVWLLEPKSQVWLAYVPGAPDAVNTLTSKVLQATSVVTVRRAGSLPPPGSLPLVADGGVDASPEGKGQALATPPPGGLVQGLAGTNDPARVAAAQPFAVQAVWLLDTASQRWLSYVPGAPASANTLGLGLLRAESVVTVLRAAEAPAEEHATDAAAEDAEDLDPSSVAFDTASEARLVELVNESRVAHGLPPLEVDLMLRKAARMHSADMWKRDYFAHDNPDGLDPFDRMREAGIEYRWAGENLARAGSAERAHELLMGSPGHRANILNDRFGRIGIGAVETPQGVLFTQLFTD